MITFKALMVHYLLPSQGKLTPGFVQPPCCFVVYKKCDLNKSCVFFEALLPRNISTSTNAKEFSETSSPTEKNEGDHWNIYLPLQNPVVTSFCTSHSNRVPLNLRDSTLFICGKK
jgi:hypothetical protein